MDSTSPSRLADDLRNAYIRYFDTAFWLNDPQLMNERRRLLEEPGALVGEVMIEPIIPYESTDRMLDVAAACEVSKEDARRVASALFPTVAAEDLRLRDHQALAIQHSFRSGTERERNVVVTSGTGSGKTESFLLPLLLRIVQESSRWPVQSEAHWWWDSPDPMWQPVRHPETRSSAVRAMILYPTNALVEDQMTRLRRAVSSIREAQPERPIWFGRYTGNTPGSGRKPKGKAQAIELAAELKEQRQEFLRLQEAQENGLEVDLSQFPDPMSGEMSSRWDMIANAPDIFVTNYSMLNTIMMRSFEDPIFQQTAKWLSSNSSNVFTLVVDELHLYRGTQGSEVAMIVRALLHRLGLAPDSPQLRVIATSASLDASDGGFDYLEQFFGVPAETFAILPGRQADIPLPRSVTPEEASNRSRTPPELSQLVAHACFDAEQSRFRATSVAGIAEKLFAEREDREDLTEAVLDRIAEADTGYGATDVVPLRAHLFVRTPRGFWACSNPKCSGVEEPTPDRVVGCLFTTPRHTCSSCGCRVLELLYCYECGDVSLGGFIIDAKGQQTLLAPDSVTEAQSGRPVFMRTRDDYVWYRPGLLDTGNEWSKEGLKIAFTPVEWNPNLGMAEVPGSLPTGLGVVVTGQDPEDRIPSLPNKCPACHYVAPAGRGAQGAFRTGRVRSPIRAHTSGLAAATQLYLSQLVRSLAAGREGRGTVEDAKTIIFTDSRDDAARTAAGVARNHYRDLIRQILRQEAHRGPDPDQILSGMNGAEANELGIFQGWLAAQKVQFGTLTTEEQEALEEARSQLSERRAIRLLDLYTQVSDSLLRIGVNPGGPNPYNQYLEDGLYGSTPWFRAYEPPEPGLWETPPIAQGREQLNRDLRAACIEAAFDRARRDLESVGVARMHIDGWQPADGVLSESQQEQLLGSVVRILGLAGRYEGSRRGGVDPSAQTPAPVRRYVDAVAQNLFWATAYNIFAIPLAGGVLYTAGIVLSPAVGAIFMSLSTVIVAINAQLLKRSARFGDEA